jgi:hypothetical protein
MNVNDPIRINDIGTRTAATSISRAEAERQFRFSFALVIILTLGTLAAVAALPMSGWEAGYGYNPQLASQTATIR